MNWLEQHSEINWYDSGLSGMVEIYLSNSGQSAGKKQIEQYGGDCKKELSDNNKEQQGWQAKGNLEEGWEYDTDEQREVHRD